MKTCFHYNLKKSIFLSAALSLSTIFFNTACEENISSTVQTYPSDNQKLSDSLSNEKYMELEKIRKHKNYNIDCITFGFLMKPMIVKHSNTKNQNTRK